MSSVCQVNEADTTWMLISTILVLGMNPALAFFEAGMLRSKNTLSLITQVFAGVTSCSVLWLIFGFSLTFGPDHGGIIGDFSHVMFHDVSYSDCNPNAPYIPGALFAMFQMMFAVITPLLMTGAFAERFKFKAFYAFTILWEIFVYYPVAHWIWGGGFLGKWGTLDFAGGIVIHTSAGAGSLVTALYLGRRHRFYDYMGEFPPSSLPLAAIGAALLWIGWGGFNGGSAFASGPVAVSAIVSTQIGCSCSAFVWLVLSWYRDKPSSIALMNGALAGLAGITPASGYINNGASIGLGFVLGVCSYFSVVIMKTKLHVDDALDVSSIHGLTGVLGALAVGLFAQLRLNPNGADGAFYGHPEQMAYQTVGVLVVAIYAGVLTFLILKVLERFMGDLRASEDAEIAGLDWAEHHEVAYHKLHVLADAEKEFDEETQEENIASSHMNVHHPHHRPNASHHQIPMQSPGVSAVSPNGVVNAGGNMHAPLLNGSHSVASDAPTGRSSSPSRNSRKKKPLNMPSTDGYKLHAHDSPHDSPH